MGCGTSRGVDLPDVYFTEAWRQSLPDLEGKIVAITGTTTGTGYVAAMELAARSRCAAILLLNRPSARAERCLANCRQAVALRESGADWRADAELRTGRGGIAAGDGSKVAPAEPPENVSGAPAVHHVDCDLMSFASVRGCVKNVQELCSNLGAGGLDVLALNAGVLSVKEGKKPLRATADGFDPVVQTNHLSQMLLLAELWPALQSAGDLEPARIVFHASNGRIGAKNKELQLKALHKQDNGGGGRSSWETGKKFAGNGPQGEYYLTKSYNFAVAGALHERLVQAKTQNATTNNIQSLCCHPGFSATMAHEKEHQGCFLSIGNYCIKKMGQSDADGTMPLLECICGAGGAAVGNSTLFLPSLSMISSCCFDTSICH